MKNLHDFDFRAAVSMSECNTCSEFKEPAALLVYFLVVKLTMPLICVQLLDLQTPEEPPSLNNVIEFPAGCPEVAHIAIRFDIYRHHR